MVPPAERKAIPKVVDYLGNRRKRWEQSRGSVDSYGQLPRGGGYGQHSMTVDDRSGDRTSRSKGYRDVLIGWKEEEPNRLNDIRIKARQMEDAAERKEQMLRVKGDNIEEASEVNDMLIDAIEAKLAILGEI